MHDVQKAVVQCRASVCSLSSDDITDKRVEMLLDADSEPTLPF